MSRLFIVDDSPTARFVLRRLLEAEGLSVVGEASDRRTALPLLERLRPDLVLLDVYLEDDSGFDVAREIKQTVGTPILVVTGVDPDDEGKVFRALQAGALDIAPKPPARAHPSHASEVARLIAQIRSLLSASRVAASLPAPPPIPASPPTTPAPSASAPRAWAPPPNPVVVLGASTGGPSVLRSIVAGLPAGLGTSIVVAHHIGSGFTEPFARWLSEETALSVVVVGEERHLEPDTLYLAPDWGHIEVTSHRTVGAARGVASEITRPSVDRLFTSAAQHLGPAALAIVLTGMGRDGSEGMLALAEAGARCVAQAPSTCVVASMPQAVLKIGRAVKALTPAEIVDEIIAHGRGRGAKG